MVRATMLLLGLATLAQGCEFIDPRDPAPADEPADDPTDEPGPDETEDDDEGVQWTSRVLYENGLRWASYRDLTSDEFSERFQQLVDDEDMMMIDVDVNPDGRQVTYSMVWQENVDRRGWAEHRNLTSDEYHDLWQRYADRGWRPLDVEGYTIDGRLLYAGIWIENREGLAWSSMRNLTSAEYADYFEEQREARRRPIDIEAYPTPDGLLYAAIWYENVDEVSWLQLRDMDRDAYQQELETRTGEGYLPIDYETYMAGNEQRYAAIWEVPANRPAFQIRTDRSQISYANLWRTYRDEGYRIVDFENDAALYGGLWIENADRFQYEGKQELDSIIETYRSDNAIPGISVAILQGGSVLYRRGFGEADQSTPKVAHSETVYSAASVSKVIGSTLAAKLEDEGELWDGTPVDLDLSDDTSDYLPDLPGHHTHQVEQLTAHLACIPHYTTSPAIPNITTHYSTALEAAEDFWDTDLLDSCTPGSSRSYSTPAFTLLGAVLEDVSGRPLSELLQEELFDRYDLDSMRVHFATETPPANYERAVPYNDAGDASSYSDNSWKVIGGGIETSTLDLARFGWKVLDGDIVDATARDDRMWVPVDPGCAGPGGGTCRNGIGWSLNTYNGRRVAEHDGSWSGARSWLRVYPDDDLVVAVMSNRRGHSPSSLIEDLTSVVLDP